MNTITFYCRLNADSTHINLDGLTSKYCFVAKFLILIYLPWVTCYVCISMLDFTCLASIFRHFWRLARQINKIFARPPSWNIISFKSVALTEGKCRFCLTKSRIQHVLTYFRQIRRAVCKWRLTANSTIKTDVTINMISKIYFFPSFCDVKYSNNGVCASEKESATTPIHVTSLWQLELL